ncbi:dihydroflavonol-4-reductase [Aureimonas glaciei]|uniref:Dihydroflavonol-4-reductase n=2 Tax=Aureimonas glaciei TaxID=1776957 RepID=A0A917DI16_9HYPH|nr:dihydroflavonol-4-reductase [Aureimonas glaciei]
MFAGVARLTGAWRRIQTGTEGIGMAGDMDRVLVTGASGFIARHIVLDLLREGYAVRGTVRSQDAAADVVAAVEGQGVSTEHLDFVPTDLTRDEGWDAAVAGCRFVIHAASPFPASLPKDRFALVPAARGGALRVVEAAARAGVERLVMTSSVAAVYYGHGPAEGRVFSERDFSDVDAPAISAYAVSKTLAEQAAWEAVAGTGLQLVAINPALVLGPLIGGSVGTSARIVQTMMRGWMPVVPDMAFGIVDVRDVALAHRRAMTVPDAAGRRFILSGGSRSLRQIGEAIGHDFPRYRRKMPRATLPDLILRVAALASSSAGQMLPELGPAKQLDMEPARKCLGVVFLPPETAIHATAASLIGHGLC